MSLFDGLLPYEVVLLVLGALFFVLLAVLLAAQIVRGKSYAGLLLFFGVPIAMIGFPSFQRIQFQDGTLTLDKTTSQLNADPTNPNLRGELAKQLAAVSPRPTRDPAVLTKIARAQFALGNQAGAERLVQKALQAAPTLPEALKLKQTIDTDRELTTLTTDVMQHPDPATKEKLAQTLTQAAGLRIANPVMLAHIADAQAALGDHARALATAETALKINPSLVAAQQVKERVAARH